ncbi:tRNA (guanosine(46)-N7)-methyltransferase TrmB [Ruficoccus amylovorans]|uniref:tRNA (guanine-N(7)-)-methyltransferase n=1 Tax=Ruficoccus amylovorans TaxID=1804625 RepID=A0A842HK23_9BACT|nr:tRNA (guanosine(46)-N7)-methyltransferase TrmB [Ruficoccus amylovorans]MBC2595511.1 tRNA (guanosine(46)-N7)-methyltransferase TrmB [Ruficoccus amylovorans]
MPADTHSDSYAAARERSRLRRLELSRWCQAHLDPREPFVLEFGCGHGHFLTAYAEANPRRNCVGIDIMTKRIEKASAKAAKRGLNRLHFLKAEADEFLDALRGHARASLVFMLFPDPWPKKRHHKHRMVQDEFLNELAEVTTPEARFCFRSDHEGYHRWSADHLYRHPRWEIRADEHWPFEHETYFQGHMESFRSIVSARTGPADTATKPQPTQLSFL